MEEEKFIIDTKIKLLELAIIMSEKITEDIREIYLDLREEILGIPNPKNQKQNGN